MSRAKRVYNDDEGFVRAAVDLLTDITSGTPYRAAVTVVPSERRGIVGLRVQWFRVQPDETWRKVAAYVNEYPNVRAQSMAAAFYQAVVHADRILKDWIMEQPLREDEPLPITLPEAQGR